LAYSRHTMAHLSLLQADHPHFPSVCPAEKKGQSVCIRGQSKSLDLGAPRFGFRLFNRARSSDLYWPLLQTDLTYSAGQTPVKWGDQPVVETNAPSCDTGLKFLGLLAFWGAPRPWCKGIKVKAKFILREYRALVRR